MKTFVLTEEQEMLRDLARELARAEIRPRSEPVDHEAACPVEGLAVLAGAGLAACTIPEAWGGSGLDAWSQVCVIEETAIECASTAWAAAQNAELAECVAAYGSDAQKRAVLPELAAGCLAAAVNAPGVSVRTDGKEYVLSGAVPHVPLAGACQWYLLPAAEQARTRWFLFGADAGVKAEREPAKLGLKGCPMGTLLLTDLRLSGRHLLEGEVSPLLAAAQTLHTAAISSGVALGALNEAVTYVNQRVQFGRTIARFENTQQVMAGLFAKAEAARSLVWTAAQVKAAGADCTLAAALAKVAAADTASVVARKCVQFMGGYGYSREYPVERKMRDAKMLELLGGTSERQKELIAGLQVVQS